jgi:hypothetical protein
MSLQFDLINPDGTLAFAFENSMEGLEATYLLSLLSGESVGSSGDYGRDYDDENNNGNASEEAEGQDGELKQPDENQPIQTALQKKHARLQSALGSMLEDYSLLSLVPLSIDDKMSVGGVVHLTDKCIGYISSKDAVPTQ